MRGERTHGGSYSYVTSRTIFVWTFLLKQIFFFWGNVFVNNGGIPVCECNEVNYKSTTICLQRTDLSYLRGIHLDERNRSWREADQTSQDSQRWRSIGPALGSRQDQLLKAYKAGAESLAHVAWHWKVRCRHRRHRDCLKECNKVTSHAVWRGTH